MYVYIYIYIFSLIYINDLLNTWKCPALTLAAARGAEGRRGARCRELQGHFMISLSLSLSMYMYIYIYIDTYHSYIYIYMYVTYIYIYIYIHARMFMFFIQGRAREGRELRAGPLRRHRRGRAAVANIILCYTTPILY